MCRLPDKTLRAGWLLISLWLLAACTVLPTPTASLPFPTLEATPTPTATIVWFPATPTPTIYTPPTARPTTELRPGQGELLLQDDFANGDDWQLGQFSTGKVSVNNGHITLAVQSARSGLQSLRSSPLAANFSAEMDINFNLCEPLDQAGLIFRAVDSANFYRIMLRCDGSIRLERVNNNTFSVLQDWTSGSGYVTGALQTVRLGVWAAGSDLRIFANGSYQFSTRLPLSAPGQFGVFVRTGGAQPVSMYFSNLSIYAVDPAQVTPMPTATPGK